MVRCEKVVGVGMSRDRIQYSPSTADADAPDLISAVFRQRRCNGNRRNSTPAAANNNLRHQNQQYPTPGAATQTLGRRPSVRVRQRAEPQDSIEFSP